ncbi:SsrA-binding protein SmpB [Candidatus Gracilibacteria bacterium]|nr:SsrA-binding protein SmpB [Candidatus Gracilibacteria bacterium]
MTKSFAKNKKAFHDYEILEKFEAGIMLNGDEVKSIRGSQINLKGAYITIDEDEAYINEAHISRYSHSSRQEHEPTRKRKLLLKTREIQKIGKEISQNGITCIPLEIYPKGGLIKLQIGLCRGKKMHDKRDSLKRKDQERQIQRQVKDF